MKSSYIYKRGQTFTCDDIHNKRIPIEYTQTVDEILTESESTESEESIELLKMIGIDFYNYTDQELDSFGDSIDGVYVIMKDIKVTIEIEEL